MKEGAILAGKYRLVRAIGRGAMGEVWAAENQLTRRPFAVKLLAADFDGEDARRRLLREASAAGQLVHPNIVEVYDVGTDEDGDPFLVMQLLKGESLGERLDRERVLSPADAVTIAAQIARALEAAHAAGIVHRDLKPDNVFLHREAGETIVKVLDFGVSKQTAAGATSSTITGMAIGTPAYMSPEQARGRKVDPRSDMWALGVVLYEMIAGQRPFEGESAFDVVGQILHGAVPSLSGTVPNAPRELADLVAGCLQRELTSRTADAGQIASTLETLRASPKLGKAPLVSDPPPPAPEPDATTMPALDAARSVFKNASTRAVVTPREARSAPSEGKSIRLLPVVAACVAGAAGIAIVAFVVRPSNDGPAAVTATTEVFSQRSTATAESSTVASSSVVTIDALPSASVATSGEASPTACARPGSSSVRTALPRSTAVAPRPSASPAAPSAAPKPTATTTSTVKFKDPG